jgi:DNA-binding CsgD family transcriptional regulator
LLTEAELAGGQHKAASRWAVAAAAAGSQLAGATAFGRFASAAVALAAGEPERALVDAEAARAGFESVNQSIDAPRARILVARALASLDRKDEALDQLETAHAALRALGAARYRDAAARDIRGLGRRVPRGGGRGEGGAGVGALTARERAIAELVTHGLSNRAIAEQLFLSIKTVESHLARIFAKLGVSSRASVAALLERSRQAAPPPG